MGTDQRDTKPQDALAAALDAAERMYLAVGAITAGDRSVSEEYLLAYTELGDALKAARDARDGWVLERKELRAAARYVVQLGNQPGMDDDEWEQAMGTLEAALGPRQELLCAECGKPSDPDCGHRTLSGKRRFVIDDRDINDLLVSAPSVTQADEALSALLGLHGPAGVEGHEHCNICATETYTRLMTIATNGRLRLPILAPLRGDTDVTEPPVVEVEGADGDGLREALADAEHALVGGDAAGGLLAVRVAIERAALATQKPALDAERLEWARWIVRQGRNRDHACPECGPLGVGVAPMQCVPHEALAFLRGSEERAAFKRSEYERIRPAFLDPSVPEGLREALSHVDTGSAEGRAFLEGFGLARAALAAPPPPLREPAEALLVELDAEWLYLPNEARRAMGEPRERLRAALAADEGGAT